MKDVLLILAAVALGFVPGLWRLWSHKAGSIYPITEVMPETSPPAEKRQSAPQPIAAAAPEVPSTAEESQLILENQFKTLFDLNLIVTAKRSGFREGELATGWRTRLAAAAKSDFKNADAQWLQFPAAAFQALLQFDSALHGNPTYIQHIRDASWACLRYRRDALHAHFADFDPITQSILRPELFPGDTTSPGTKELRNIVSDVFGDLEERWAAALRLFPRSGNASAITLTEEDLENLFEIAGDELLSGGTLQTVEHRFSALPPEAQDKTMQSMMKQVVYSSPAELSEYLQSLPKDIPWRQAGIATLLKSLPPGSEEALAWARELTP